MVRINYALSFSQLFSYILYYNIIVFKFCFKKVKQTDYSDKNRPTLFDITLVVWFQYSSKYSSIVFGGHGSHAGSISCHFENCHQ